jgi:hypothetical protein
LSSAAFLALALTKALSWEGHMSVQVSPAVGEPSSPLPAPQADPQADSSFDARWAARIERGRQHDLAVKRKLRIALSAAAVVALLVVLFFGLASGAL